MWMQPLASPGNIDWRLIVPNQQPLGIGAWTPIIKPGNAAWMYAILVGSGSGGAAGASGAAGTNRSGGGAGGSGFFTCCMFPWALLPDVIYAIPGLGGAGGSPSLGNGAQGSQTILHTEPTGGAANGYYIAFANTGYLTSGASGASGSSASVLGQQFGFGLITPYGSTGGAYGQTGAAGSNMTNAMFCGGGGGGGTNTSNNNFAGGGLWSWYSTGPGQIIGAGGGFAAGHGGGAAGGGNGLNGRELGQSAGSPLALVMPSGNARPIFFPGGCGGGSNGASGVGGNGGNGDWGAGGGGGGAGVTGGNGGKGGDGFILIGNF